MLRFFLTCLFLIVFSIPVQAGPVGKTLGEMGMSDEVQTLGDTLQQEAAALASGKAWRLTGALKGKTVDSVRGASGALSELALNSGELICNMWLINFHVRIRNMHKDNLHLSGDDRIQHLQLIQKMQEFVGQLELECTRVGLIGLGGPSTEADDDEAAEEEEPEEEEKEWRITPRDGETVGDAICRYNCSAEYSAMREEERLLSNVKKDKEKADKDVRESQTDLAKKQKWLKDAQQEIKETDAILAETLNGNDSAKKKARHIQAGKRNGIAKATVTRLTEEIPNLKKKIDVAKAYAKSVQSSLDWRQSQTENVRKAYYDCLKKCIDSATRAGEKMTLKCPDDYPCPTKTGSNATALPKSATGGKQACARPPGTTSIIIGPNDKYGSGAVLKGKAKGMAMGALGSMLGGKGGGSIGSPMGGNSAKGPPTVKDPIKDKYKIESEVENADGDEVELALGGTWTKNGNLLISAEIEDADQDGTFQAIFIDDGQGNRHVPIGYYLYDLYRDWKLTVWWTHDKWVDGEHVYHDEGEEISAGRDELGGGAIALFDKDKAANNGVWNQLGFGTAQKGAKGVGAEFAITSPMLAAGQAMRVYAHITQPKNNPVNTIPVVFDISMDPSSKHNMLKVVAVTLDEAAKQPCYKTNHAPVSIEAPQPVSDNAVTQEAPAKIETKEVKTEAQKDVPQKAEVVAEEAKDQNAVTKGLNSIFKNKKSGKKINQGAGNN